MQGYYFLKHILTYYYRLGGELGELEHTEQFGQGMDDPFGMGRPTGRGMRVGSRLFFGGGTAVQGRGTGSFFFQSSSPF